MQKLYTAKATATGGRNGHIRSEDGALDIEVRTPASLGGPQGKYLNPEILFAGGYAACFDSALSIMINAEKVQAGTTSVTAEVSLNKAHQVCPYSNATRGNVKVTL